MFGLFKSQEREKVDIQMAVAKKLAAVVADSLVSVIVFVPEDKYLDYFLVSYAAFDKCLREVSIDHHQFMELFVMENQVLGKAANVNMDKYDFAFGVFLDEYIGKGFSELTQEELELMQKGAALLGGPLPGALLCAHFTGHKF
jgi:hypothetical protein